MISLILIIRENARFRTKIYTALIWEWMRSEFGRAQLKSEL